MTQETTPTVRGTFRCVHTAERTWLFRVDVPNSGDHIYATDPEPTGGMRGFGGRELRFGLEDGTVLAAVGPWHSNSEALFAATGIDLTALHETTVRIERNGVALYIEDAPVLGDFDRGRKLAESIAQRDGERVFVHSESNGGSSGRWVNP